MSERFVVTVSRGYLSLVSSGQSRYGLTAIVTDSLDNHRTICDFRSEDYTMWRYPSGNLVPGQKGSELALLEAEIAARRLNRARPIDLVL